MAYSLTHIDEPYCMVHTVGVKYWSFGLTHALEQRAIEQQTIIITKKQANMEFSMPTNDCFLNFAEVNTL